MRAGLAAVLVARTAINGAVRGTYPFLPAIARGLDAPLGVLAAVVAARNLAGFVAPAAAVAAERSGRRTIMLGAAVAATAGSALAAGASGVVTIAAGFVLVGLAKPAFDVAMQAWFADRVPGTRRGRVLGIAQLSWALGLAVTVPVAGVLLRLFGWRSLFVLMALYGCAGAVAVQRLIARDTPATRTRSRQPATAAQRRLLGVVLLYNVSFEMLLVVYGPWLEQDLGFDVMAIGVFTLVVVGAELLGAATVAAVSDRLGLRRSVLVGVVGFAVALAGLGLVSSSVPAAVVAVAVVFVMAEMTIVSTVPLMTTLSEGPGDRLMGRMVLVTSAGRALGALVAVPLFARGGIAACGLIGAGVLLVAAVLVRRDR